MLTDDGPIAELSRRLQEGLQRVGELETQVERLWKELHGLRETLENMTDRNTHR